MKVLPLGNMRIWSLPVLLSFLLILAPLAQAAESPRLQLALKPTSVKVGQTAKVEVLIQHAPDIYGADVRLVFDPTRLEVIDADQQLPGVQIEPGKFLDPAQSFALQHLVNNETGTIDYALTLLNPAPAAYGDGQLAQITFRAKAAGRTTLTLTEGLFGTRTGETVAPRLSSVEVEIVDKQANAPESVEGVPPSSESSDELTARASPPPKSLVIPMPNTGPTVVAAVSLGVIGVGLMYGWREFHRARRK